MNADPSCIGCAMELVLGSPCGLMNNGPNGCRWFFWSPETHGELTKTWRKTKENTGNVSNVGNVGLNRYEALTFDDIPMAHPMELYRGEE
jgi:hypothetical protein